MTTKSYSNRFAFFLNRSTYRSGFPDSEDQKKVSKSWILRFPQIFCWLQSRKQSLFYLDRDKTKRKWTYRRTNITCESDSHLSSYFNRSKSESEKVWKLGRQNMTSLTIRVGLNLLWETEKKSFRVTDMGAHLLFQSMRASAFLWYKRQSTWFQQIK